MGIGGGPFFLRHTRRGHAQGAGVKTPVFENFIFKKVNDNHGHGVGDSVLKEFASRMVRGIREFDTAARCGGEEFVVVMPDCDVRVAANVADRLRCLVSDSPFSAGDAAGIAVTVSIGIACRQGDDDTPDALLARADEALYEAKRNGRNRVEVQPDMTVGTEKAASG